MKLLNTGEVKGMSDFTNTDLQNEELEKILSEVRSSEGIPEAGDADGTPSKEWSLEDIDRLIAEESGESFEPSEPKTRSAAQKLEQMLSGSEYDEGMFTLKTDDFDLSAEEEIPEPTDIFSGGEVFGQEMFFEDDGIADDFDPSNFELETVVMPDAVPEPAVRPQGKGRCDQVPQDQRRGKQRQYRGCGKSVPAEEPSRQRGKVRI